MLFILNVTPIIVLISIFSMSSEGLIPFNLSGIYYFILGILPGFIIYQLSQKALKAKRKYSCKNVLIYGTNRDRQIILYKIKHMLSDRYNVLGFVDHQGLQKNKSYMGYPVIDSQKQLLDLLQSGKVTGIFISQDVTTGELYNVFPAAMTITTVRLETSLKSLISDSLDKDTISSKMASVQIMDTCESYT